MADVKNVMQILQLERLTQLQENIKHSHVQLVSSLIFQEKDVFSKINVERDILAKS